MPGIIFLLALLVIIFIVLLSSIKVVNTGYLYVVERLGQFHKILHFSIIVLDFLGVLCKNMSRHKISAILAKISCRTGSVLKYFPKSCN